MPKKESGNQFLASIKGYHSILICQNLPICNPRTLFPNINSDSKFEEIYLEMLSAESENDALTDGRIDGQTDTRTLFLNGGHFLKCRDIKKNLISPATRLGSGIAIHKQ